MVAALLHIVADGTIGGRWAGKGNGQVGAWSRDVKAHLRRSGNSEHPCVKTITRSSCAVAPQPAMPQQIKAGGNSQVQVRFTGG
jgi:hypothetical protein